MCTCFRIWAFALGLITTRN